MCEALGGRSSESQGCRYFALAHSTPVHSPGSPLSLRLWLSEEPEPGRGKYCNRTAAALWRLSVMTPAPPVQFSRSVVSDSLQPNGLQHARLPCPSPTPGVCSDSRPLSQ